MLIVAHIIFFITKIIFLIRKVSQAMINQLVEVMHCYCLLDWPFCRYFGEFRGDGAFHNISVKKTPVDQCFETPKNDLTDICACSANPRRGCILGCNFFWQMEILFMRKDLKNKQRLIGKLFDGVN